MESYLNYQVLVNNKVLPYFHSICNISNEHIKRSKDNFIQDKKNKGIIKDSDIVKFIFKYCHSE